MTFLSFGKFKSLETTSIAISKLSLEAEKNHIRIGTLGGTLCSIWASFSLADATHTAFMAVVGTVVSYVTSRLLGMWRKR